MLTLLSITESSIPYRAPPPPKKTSRVGSFIMYKCLVFPKKCQKCVF